MHFLVVKKHNLMFGKVLSDKIIGAGLAQLLWSNYH